jgi:hypothetical protein
VTESQPRAMPRRSYPLVVAPPGGFEDAVRRGRRMRRRRTSGTSGAALVLVGALGYSLLGHGSGLDRINSTDTPPDGGRRPVPSAGATYVPDPAVTASPSAATGRNGTAVAAGTGATLPTAGPTAITTRPTRRPGQVTRAYARRPVIHQDDPTTNTAFDCLAQQANSSGFCTSANVDDTRANEGVYTLEYWVCRPVGSGNDATLTFTRTQHADFAAIDKANNDTVWTWSAGQPVVGETKQLTIPAGYCVRWWTEWDGFDDFGLTPPQGQYTLTASSFASGPAPAQWTFTHQ